MNCKVIKKTRLGKPMRFFLSAAALLCALSASAQYTVSGGAGVPLLADDNAPARIRVYLLNGLSGAEIAYTSDTDEPHRWYRYRTRYADAVPLTASQSGRRSVVGDLLDGWGYFVETSSQPTPTFVWIIDYSLYRPALTALTVQEEDDRCTFLKLVAHGDIPSLEYRTYTGAPIALPRTSRLTYNTVVWSEEAATYLPHTEELTLQGDLLEIIIDAPLAPTAFTLTSDDYAAHFGDAQTVFSGEYTAVAVATQARMTTRTATGETEEHTADAEVAFSAPLHVRWEATANEPVAAFYVWNLLRVDPRTGEETSLIRYTDRAVEYTFRESGRYLARLEVTDAQTVCFDNSQRFTIVIGTSSLVLPNAFSPGSSAGVNDIYRVTGRSLVRFKASIFNRHGNLLFSWDDPAQGWDGTVAGRYVPTGVYYIVVEATGADGTVYRESKDINILRARE
jgi:gliding motility-associated-like protein